MRTQLDPRPRARGLVGATLALGLGLAFVGLGGLAAPAAHAAPCLERRHALVADLGLHIIGAGYQRTVGCGVVLQVSAGLYDPWTVNLNVLGLGVDREPDGDVKGGVIRIRSFLFPLGEAPSGLWISPFVQAGIVGGTRDQTLAGAAVAAGLSVGWTWALGPRWLLGLGLGAQYHTAAFEGSAAFPGFARVAPTVDINLAYRF